MRQEARIEKKLFGKTDDGREKTLYRIYNNAGSFIEIEDYGCTVRSMYIQNKERQLQNVLVVPGTVMGKEWAHPLATAIWVSKEVEDNAVAFGAKAKMEEIQLSAEVRFRLKDFDRLVIDYVVNASVPHKAYLTHQLAFCLDDTKSLDMHTMRVFTHEELSEYSQRVPVDLASVSNLKYLPIRDGEHTYLSFGKEIHPFAELAAEKSNLALTAYSTMEAMAISTQEDSSNALSFRALPLQEPAMEWRARTVFGIDLLYHEGDSMPASPFMFFPH